MWHSQLSISDKNVQNQIKGYADSFLKTCLIYRINNPNSVPCLGAPRLLLIQSYALSLLKASINILEAAFQGCKSITTRNTELKICEVF